MLRKAKNRLRDILIRTEHLSKIRQQINSKEDLEKNIYLSDSAERSIEIIGEAVKALPSSVKQLSPDTPWKAIAGMRDNVIHDYNDIDYDVVWKVINIDAPALNQETTKILNHLSREEYLEYKAQLVTEPTSQSYFTRIRQQERLDIAIAKTIIQEYPVKFQHVAIAEVKDIIGASDRALELSTNSENTTCFEYVTRIVAASIPESTQNRTDLEIE